MHKRTSSFKSLLSLKHFAVFLALLVMVLVAVLIGYLIGVSQVRSEVERKDEQTRLLMKQIKEIAKIDGEDTGTIVESKKQESEIRRLQKELREILDRESLNASHEYAPKDKKAVPPVAESKTPHSVKQGNAQLVIIMDDVSYAHDVKAIRSVGLPLVMSFLPPSHRHSESASLAHDVNGYMVHLPLEALDFEGEEDVTLRVSDSKDTIAAQIQKIKKLYPNVHYINNHTGSKFTADEEAMDRLISVMKANGLIFVDSRTTAQSKAKMVDTKYGMRYLGRDVFLDHHDGVENIKKQIREAVEIAKRNGSAIAIGHPRPDTLQALKESKDVLSEVKLVGIDKI
ncbi:MAG: divergent polysaccharide deacetylase family protein [Sulfuricurvum sp.]|nr:divergent polysaccharide deacetylase family protein [Sulfuricurvum sp.]